MRSRKPEGETLSSSLLPATFLKLLRFYSLFNLCVVCCLLSKVNKDYQLSRCASLQSHQRQSCVKGPNITSSSSRKLQPNPSTYPHTKTKLHTKPQRISSSQRKMMEQMPASNFLKYFFTLFWAKGGLWPSLGMVPSATLKKQTKFLLCHKTAQNKGNVELFFTLFWAAGNLRPPQGGPLGPRRKKRKEFPCPTTVSKSENVKA